MPALEASRVGSVHFGNLAAAVDLVRSQSGDRGLGATDLRQRLALEGTLDWARGPRRITERRLIVDNFPVE
jgi:hypothetical protein